MQLSGLGKMKPNLALMGYKRDWAVADEDELEAYFGVIQSVSFFSVSFFSPSILILS